MSRSDVRVAASRYWHGGMEAPGSYNSARLMPTTVRSRAAASIHSGRAHLVHQAAIATDGERAVLVTRWVCGNGSISARPVTVDEDTCETCLHLSRFPLVDGFVVYRCYEPDGRLLYIGSSGNVRQRLRAHRTDARWWRDDLQVEVTPVDSEGGVRLAEAIAIADELPVHNRHNIPLRVLKGGAA